MGAGALIRSIDVAALLIPILFPCQIADVVGGPNG
jgi:hypothetical protein